MKLVVYHTTYTRRVLFTITKFLQAVFNFFIIKFHSLYHKLTYSEEELYYTSSDDDDDDNHSVRVKRMGGSGFSNKICSICLEKIYLGDNNISLFNCTHNDCFHHRCAWSWVVMSAQTSELGYNEFKTICPLCRDESTFFVPPE